MATDRYIYKLTEKKGNGVVKLFLDDVNGTPNVWEEANSISDILVVSGGIVQTTPIGQECRAPGVGVGKNVLVLKGANWSTKVGEAGDAELFLYQNSGSDYSWELTGIT